MAVFISSRINGICNEVSKLCWHPNNPVLAVATNNPNDSGEINVIEIDEKKEELSISRPYLATSLSWHPTSLILAVGWSTGCISFIYVSEKNVVDVKDIMSCSVNSLTWSGRGTKILATGIDGTISIMRRTALGDIQLKPLATMSVDAKINTAILLHMKMDDSQDMDIPSLAKAAVKGDEKALEILSSKKSSELTSIAFDGCESSTFLVGCSDGRVLRVSGDAAAANTPSETGLNRITTLMSCEGGICKLLCHPSNGMLIIITDMGILYHNQLTPPNGATLREITKMKLAVNINSHPSITWAGPSLLAMALGESAVRMWDVERADNYTLEPNVSECNTPDKSVKVTQVAYSFRYQILACGLSNGMVAFWQYGTELTGKKKKNLCKLLRADPFLHNGQSDTWLPMVDPSDDGDDDDDDIEGHDADCDLLTNQSDWVTRSVRGSNTNELDRGPEYNWHPQPTAILTYQTEDEFNSGLPETGRQVHVLAWDGAEERLAIAVSTRQLHDIAIFNHGLNPKCAVFLLERQSLCGGFGGSGCVVVQTGPRSLAMLTTVQSGSTSSMLKPVVESTKDSLNPLSVPSSTGLPTSFIATSTALHPGTISRKVTSTIQDELNPLPLIREHEAQVEDQIRALYCTQEYLAYWNGNRVSSFKHAAGDCIVHVASFPCEFRLVGMYDQNLFTVEPFKLQVRSLPGTVKQLINFAQSDGTIVKTAQCGTYLLCLTDLGKVRIFDLSKREIKSMHSSKSLVELVFSTILTSESHHSVSDGTKQTDKETLMTASASTKEIRIAHVAVNTTGDAVSFTFELLADGCVCAVRWPSTDVSQNENVRDIKSDRKICHEKGSKPVSNSPQNFRVWIPDTRIYVYHLEKDKLQYFDCCSLPRYTTLTAESLESKQFGGRWPRRHFWDQYEPRLLVVEATSLPDEHPLVKRGTQHCTEKSEKRTRSSKRSATPNAVSDEEIQMQVNSTDSIINMSRAQSRASSKLTDLPSMFKKRPTNKLSTLIISLFTGPEQDKPVIQEQFPMAMQHSALLGVEVPYYYFAVRCDLVYRLVNEQCQRRRELATTAGRRLVGDELGGLESTMLDIVETQMDKSASGDKSVENKNQKSTPTMCVNPAPTTDSETKPSNTGLKIHYIHRRIMRDFVDLEWTDANTREAMLTFSYYLTMGEMDAAFKAMKLIKSPAVWQNMARMCVSTCRLDVARVCLGKMGNAMAAMMVREAREREPEPEAQAGELALQLGMCDEAERLFIQCGRWDLVIRLYQSLGQWEKALQVAATHNRISLRATHYAYAKELETSGKLKEAMEHYVLSETHRFEVPRMLKSSPRLLETFVNEQQDKTLHRWWAQTLEAAGHLDEARNYYIQAKDYLSLVRVLCCLGKETEAETLCNETGDPAACYHLARQMEANGNADQAIRLFTRAKAYSSAVRLCKEHNRNDHLYSLAQLGRIEDMLEAAIHLESCPAYAHKAVLLFHKAGQIGRAVELAFKTRQFAALQTVAGSLDDRIDPVLLKQCAEFFTQNNQFDRAVDVLAAGKQYWDALKLCAEYNVPITEELVEKLTPVIPAELDQASATGYSPELIPEAERTSILIELGELCLSQGQYHLACKKFTQAGSRLAAMKALLRSGDTEKIVFFANVSKQKEIYVMAANYLQTLDEWRTNVDTMRTIVNFYTRGKAPESLASFYEACAHAEIEDFGSYEKATGALTEAYKVLLKAVNSTSAKEANEMRLQKRLAQIKNKATMCKEFAETQLLFAVDPVEAMRNCQTLLENVEPGDILRPGDIYAAMIREFVAKEKYQAALACMEEMRERLQGTNQSITRYLDRNTLDSLHEALNLPPATRTESVDYRKDGVDLIESPAFDDQMIEASVSDASDEDY